MSQELILKNAIISYPNLFVAQQINHQGDPKFSATFILPADFDWAAANVAIEDAIAAAKAVGKLPATATSTNIKIPWQDATGDGFPGQWLAKSYGDRMPQVVDQSVQPIIDQNLIFAGCIVNAYVKLVGYNQNGGGVSVRLNGVQIVQNTNVARLDNVKDVKDVFQPVAGGPPASAPMPGGYPQPGAPAQAGQPATYAPPVQAGPPGIVPAGAPGVPQNAPQPGAVPPGQPWNQ